MPNVVRGDRDDVARTDRKEGLPGHTVVELPKFSVREMVLQERRTRFDIGTTRTSVLLP